MRMRSFKQGIDPDEARRKREELNANKRSDKRQAALAQRRGRAMQRLEADASEWDFEETDFDFLDEMPEVDHSRERAQSLGREAVEEIETLIPRAKDIDEFSRCIPYLREKYSMQSIGFENLGEPDARLVFQINPKFEIYLNGPNAMEMRVSGDGGVPFGTSTIRSQVQWKTQGLTIGANTYRVGHTMHASPLTIDHPHGTLARADADHTAMMKNLPRAGDHPSAPAGAKSDDMWFLKGHLLNDNLGGLAVSSNLYPITSDANKNHSNSVEQYLRHAVKAGYVYDYKVTMVTKAVNPVTAPGFNGKYYVDSDMHVELTRLNTNLTPVASTKKTGVIKSYYGKKSDRTFEKSDHKAEFTDGSRSKPMGPGGKVTTLAAQKSTLTSNKGLYKNISAATQFTAPAVP